MLVWESLGINIYEYIRLMFMQKEDLHTGLSYEYKYMYVGK